MDYTLAAFGQFALVMMTAPNLRVLLTNPDLSRFGFYGTRLRPIVIDQRLIGVELDVSAVDDDMRDMALLVSLGCVLRFYPELVGDDFVYTMVCLPLGDPDGRLREIAGLPLSLNADRTLALWPEAQSERPLRNANPILYEAYGAATRSLLDAPELGEDFRARVQTAIAGHLNEPGLLEMVAGSLGLTARTLQRRLSRSGLKFRTMVDQSRREAAIRSLVFGETSLTQIAWELGYTDLASFAHAFQRWTGSTPGRFRRQARGEVAVD
jgi:AraC-like DNA-binding protein